MRLIVLDTNVIVSAGLKLNSVPFRLVIDWVLTGRIQAVACPAIHREYRQVLWRPKFARFGFPPEWIEDLMALSLRLPDPAPWPYAMPDPKDAVFLALARAARAWLVTGNLRHFPKSSRGRVNVVSPADYLHGLQEPSPRS